MNNISRQKQLYDELKKYDLVYRKPSWADYPPYHQSDYFEPWVNRQIEGKSIKTDRLFLPIHWTAAYKEEIRLQPILNKLLSRDEKYFTISTHDDAVKEEIPNNLSFSAGGLRGDKPIPLIVRPIPPGKYDISKKTTFCSFKGSITHPIRYKMEKSLIGKSDYVIETGQWKEEVQKTEETRFLELMSKSVFSLCPRGYGATSYRLYESLQLGSIPVYIGDKFWLPFEDKIDWASFSVLISENDIDNIDLYLRSFTEDDIQQMRQKGKEIWENYFTFEKAFEEIKETIENEN